MIKKFPYYTQLDSSDCGPTCLRMIAKYYGRTYSVQYLREHAFILNEGVSMLGISDSAELIGFRTMGVRITLEQLRTEVPLPCILHWNQQHFVVCYKIRKGKYYIADPASKKVSYDEKEIECCWCSTLVEGKETGTALLLEPGPDFYDCGVIEERLAFANCIFQMLCCSIQESCCIKLVGKVFQVNFCLRCCCR